MYSSASHSITKRVHSLPFVIAYAFFCFVAALISAPYAHSQDISQRCYGVADGYAVSGGTLEGAAAEDTLVFINRNTGDADSVDGNIPNIESTFNIEAIAFQRGENTLYAADGGQLGTLDLTNGNFTASPNPIGSGEGYVDSVLTSIAINDVDGLSFDPTTKQLWGIHRRIGADLLVKIDSISGQLVPDSFPNPVISSGFVDFVEVKAVAPGVLDVDDIAIDPSSGLAYATVNNGGDIQKLVVINRQNGATAEVGQLVRADNGALIFDIEGLSFFNDGSLYGSAGVSGGGSSNSLYQIDKLTAKATRIGAFGSSVVDIEAVGCLTSDKPTFVHASDGTFVDYVLLSWTPLEEISSYKVFRSETAGSLGSLLVDGVTSSKYKDTSAVLGKHYFYTIETDIGEQSNQDEGWRPASADTCIEGEECIYEALGTSACAGANGFLSQINIASVVNRQSSPLAVTVDYRDLVGEIKGSVTATISGLQKMDFIINELGLEADTYGTVCVSTDATVDGAWGGGVAIYKDNELDGSLGFGGEFDFVLYYPFTQPRTGPFTLPLNTFHFGVSPSSTVANWIRITDAVRGDGFGLTGELQYLDQNGDVILSEQLVIDDGGRRDRPGHEGVAGPDNVDTVGMARFIPDSNPDDTAAKYYISHARYYYNCLAASCTNFHTAFVVPYRPASTVAMSGPVSTSEGMVSVLEYSNIAEKQLKVNLTGFQNDGQIAGTNLTDVPQYGTRHVIVNQTPTTGFLSENSVGSATVQPNNGAVSVISVFYKLDEFGILSRAFAAPLVGSPGAVQQNEWNGFLGNKNISEVYNTSDAEIKAQLNGYDAVGTPVLLLDLVFSPKETKQLDLVLPIDTYGTLVLQGDKSGLVFRNYVMRDDYALPFFGQ